MSSSSISILVVLSLSLLDVLTGIIGAIKTQSLKSESLRNGVFKKFGYLILMIMCYIIDIGSEYIGLTLSVELLPIVVLYLAFTEVTSIIENLCDIAPEIKKLNLLKYFSISDEDKEEDENE